MSFSLYGPAFEMPAEPSGVVMCIEGIMILGLFIWRTGLLKRRAVDGKQCVPEQTVMSSSVYECCEYEKRFALAFSGMNTMPSPT